MLSVQLNPTKHPVFHDVTLATLSFYENLFIGQGSSVSCMHQDSGVHIKGVKFEKMLGLSSGMKISNYP